MKIIAGAIILLATALGLPSIVGSFDPGAPVEFVNVPNDASKDFCRLTYDQIAKDIYRCDRVFDAASNVDVAE